MVASSKTTKREGRGQIRGTKMGIIAKSKSGKNSSENWGMGFLLVFFPEDTSSSSSSSSSSPTTTSAAATFPFSSSSPTPPQATSSPNRNSSKTIRRSNSNNPIITKTQSTISICALLLFLTLLLFTLSTFEPTIPNPSTTISINKTPRKFLSQKPQNKLKTTKTSYFSLFSRTFWPKDNKGSEKFRSLFALQGMGKLYRRGTRAMSDLVVAHVMEETNEDEFRLFLRVLHRSGLTARADVVFVFPSLFASRFESLIQEENDSFLKLVNYYKQLNRTSHDSVSAPSFDVSQFLKSGKKQMGEPLWGKRIRVNGSGNFSESGGGEGELTWFSYGSVVGFEVSELDPENSLAGFLDNVPMSLRRWACYPMLLGRVRRNFKNVMLVDVKNLVLFSDPLGRVRNRSPESVYIRTKQESSSSKHNRKNSEKTQSHCQVNSAILMGGTRGIRRLSNAMLTETARVAMQHKKKSTVTESGILSQLVGNVHILKNIDLITSTGSIPGMSSLTGSNSSLWNNYSIIQREGNSNHDINSIIMKQICSCEVESYAYRDC